MKTVLVNRPIHQDAIDRLKEEAEVLTPFSSSEAEQAEIVKQVHGVLLAMGLTMTAEVIESCQKLEVIARHGAGVDIVDLEAAAKCGVYVTNTPYGPTESTAEHAFMLMMAAARKLTTLDRVFRGGDFSIRERIVGRELKDKSVGVIGYGRIGRRFAQMCRAALDMTVYTYDPVIDPSEAEANGAVLMTDLLEMVRKVDVISIHCPLNAHTRHIVNRDVLEAMKPEAILVNASRGPTMDEKAVLEALRENKIAGAGLDVFDPEPPARDNPLFALDNVVVTPHCASFTEEGRRRMGVTAAEDILRVFRGEKPEYPVVSID